jgi:ectoine hydroxylase-related dioxygenase (phytanoyl-CoA dioxygenase family)
MLTPAEVKRALDRIRLLQPNDGFAPRTSQWTYHCSFLDAHLAYRREALALGKELFTACVERHLVGYRILQCNIYVKPPGVGEINLHQNWPAIADLSDTSLTLWCPLVDVDEENGVLKYIPGSHKLLPHVQGPDCHSFVEGMEADLQDLLEWEALAAGEGIFADDSLIHGSEPNRSAQPRIAVQLILVPADATPAYFHKVDDDVFEIVEADDDFWVRHQHQDLRVRQADWRHIAFVRNENRSVPKGELEALLRDGPRIREQGLRLRSVDRALPEAAARPPAKSGILRRLLGRA